MESNRKEKIAGISYVTIIFLVFFVCCTAMLFYKNAAVINPEQKDLDIARIKRIEEFSYAQNKEMLIIDSVYGKIRGFNSDVRANYEETEINFLLNDLKNLYTSHIWDARYKIFFQFAECCEMWLADKKNIGIKKQNISGFTKNLEECEAGISYKEVSIVEKNK